MGTWGHAIFADDFARDIKSEYTELLEDQVDAAAAADRIIETYANDDPDDGPIVWLALAAAQHKVGRLRDDVRDRALDVIDKGFGLDRWVEAGAKRLEKRKAALQALRADLVGPQPTRKAVKPLPRRETDLEIGDVIALRTDSGRYRAFVVYGHTEERPGRVIERSTALWALKWWKRRAPRANEVAGLKLEPDPYLPPLAREYRRGNGERRPSKTVARGRASWPDWRDVGFEKVGVVAGLTPPREPGPAVIFWDRLAEGYREQRW